MYSDRDCERTLLFRRCVHGHTYRFDIVSNLLYGTSFVGWVFNPPHKAICIYSHFRRKGLKKYEFYRCVIMFNLTLMVQVELRKLTTISVTRSVLDSILSRTDIRFLLFYFIEILKFPVLFLRYVVASKIYVPAGKVRVILESRLPALSSSALI